MRKYLVYYEGQMQSDPGACGRGEIQADQTPGPTNLNNTTGGMVAEVHNRRPPGWPVGQTCWDGPEHWGVDVHEWLHIHGASQRTWFSTSGFHCYDGLDVLCYNDGSTDSQLYSTAWCGDQVVLLDCNHNTYFTTALSGGLAEHNYQDINHLWYDNWNLGDDDTNGWMWRHVWDPQGNLYQ